MPRRQPVPTLWLMTDERSDASLRAAILRLPRGAGIIFRHYATPPADRRRRFEEVRALAQRRGLLLLLAGSPREAIAWRADGWHGSGAHRLQRRLRLRTTPAHSRTDLIAAARARADLAFLSPVFATRSHPGAATLGPIRFGLLTRDATVRIGALGGMTRRRYRRIKPLGATAWAAIDAWSA